MTAITYDEAHQIALGYLVQQNCEFELVLVDDKTMTLEFGWAFFYTTKIYQETQNFRYMLGGNAPIIIDNVNGAITVTGTAGPLEYYIEEYRTSRNKI
ncbi:hypothetical protein HB762_04670 [Vibrio campbellii]|uniref:Immunity protein 35 domain-containing protein n=1 Tax=Vibrio campbellii TaxID=680 RepID=A0ABY5I9L9_9VIBR|nr:YrhB domain-containing protein [Vibrio campbellii]UTZ30739.1 hypothetical protein HB762_04670 [Vibrio campbellii]